MFCFSDISKSNPIHKESNNYKLQLLHYKLLEEKLYNTKQNIHDFKKHINIIKAYIKAHEYIKLSDYIKEIETCFLNEDSFIITGNQLVDLILNIYNDKIVNHSIKINHEVMVLNISPITDFDFNIVISNILENAIDSCLISSNKNIKIKLYRKENMIILKVLNSCDYVNTNFLSLKKDKDRHGYGINNIKKIVKKYNGYAKFVFDEDNNLFISTIFFCL